MRAAILAVLALSLSGCPTPAKEEPNTFSLSSGNVAVDVQLNPFTMALRNGTKVVLKTLAAGSAGDAYGTPAVTVDAYEEVDQVFPGWDGYRPHESPWQHAAAATLKSRDATTATLAFPVENGSILLDITVVDGRVKLFQHLEQPAGTPTIQRYNKSTMSFEMPANAAFLGLGERYARINYRGDSIYSWAEEAGTGAGENVPPGPTNPGPNGPSMTYFPVPLAHTNLGFSIHLDTTFRSEMHFGSERPDAWRVAVGDAAFHTTIYVDDDPLHILDLYTQDTGRPIVPAPWAFGNRRRINRGAMQDGVPEWQRMRALHMPITGIDDALHFLPHRSELGIETELMAWTSQLHAAGFKALGYFNPYVSATYATAAEDFAFGKDHNLFLKDPDGQPHLTFFISGTAQQIAAIDLTNPEAVAWFETILGRAVALGYDGWMHDFGEYTDRQSSAFNGMSGEELHNLFPVLSAKAARDYLQRVKPDDHLFFVRSGYTGSQAHVPAVWGGDPEASFDTTQGIPGALKAGLNLGMSGVPYWGTDTQGYKCLNAGVDRNKEQYFRWLQLGAVSPIMMDQDRCFALTHEEPKWTLWSDADTIAAYRRWAGFHQRLQPYFMVLAHEAHDHGTPIMRHPFLLHPNAPETWNVEDAFYLGPSLYVLPVVVRGQTQKQSWLPPGTWVDLDDRRRLDGGTQATIATPMDKLPILLKVPSMLPLLDASVESLAPATDVSVPTAQSLSDRLDVMVALRPGDSTSMTLADGTVLTAAFSSPSTSNPDGLMLVAQEDLASCSHCHFEDAPGDVQRIRLNGSVDATTMLSLNGVTVSASGGAARRVRFEVLLLEP